MLNRSSNISDIKGSFISQLRSSIFHSGMNESYSQQPNLLSLVKMNNSIIPVDQSLQLKLKPQDSFVKIEPEEIKVSSQKPIKLEKKLPKIQLRIHGRKRAYKPKIIQLKEVCIILDKIFKGERVDKNELQLQNSYINLITAFVVKKFGNNKSIDLNNKDIKTENKIDLLKDLIDYAIVKPSKKRVEENNKFIYKHTLKYLKAQFYTSKNLRYNKESEQLFYEYYFDDISRQKNIPIELFYDPLNITSKTGKKAKTIRNDHLILLFNCRIFKNNFFSYIETNFKDDYQSSIYKKVEKLLLPLEKQLGESDQLFKSELIDNFIRKLNANKRCKFPWSSMEIDHALNHFAKHINKLMIKANYNEEIHEINSE